MIYLLLNENGQIIIIICTDLEVGILYFKINTLQTSILRKLFNLIVLRTAKTLRSFGRSECNRVTLNIVY